MSERRPARRRARGGSEARRAARGRPKLTQLPYLTRKLPAAEILTDEGLDIIETNAETILAEIGIEFRDDDEALALWKGAGADVEGERVRLPRGLARSLLETAPGTFTQHARNPERSVRIGGDATVFAPVYGPPFVRDLDRGRRYATIEDFRNFVKLAGAVSSSDRARPRGRRTRVSSTSAPASRHSASASASSRNSMPISARMVSALVSMMSRPSSSRTSLGGSVRLM